MSDDRHVGWARLLAGISVANIADGLLVTATPLLAVRMTDSPSVVAAVTAFTRLPWLLLSVPVGMMLDRVDRRAAMAWAVVLRSLAALLLLAIVLRPGLGPASLCAAVFLLGAGEVVVDTAGHTLVPAFLPPDRLVEGNSRIVLLSMLGNDLVGPALGGAIFSVAAALPFGAAATCYAAAAAALASLPRPRLQPEEHQQTAPDLSLGTALRWMARQPLLVRVLGVQISMNITQNIIIAVAVLYAIRLLHMSEAAFGLLLAVGAVGGISAGALLPRLQRRVRPERLLAVALFALSLSLLTLTISRSALVAAAAVAINSACFVTIGVVTDSIRQAAVPDAMLGRIAGSFRFLTWGVGPIAAMAGGLIAELQGLAAPFAATALLSGALAVCVAVDRSWTASAEILSGGPAE